MSLWRQITHGLRKLTHRETDDQNIADEVRHYFDQAVAEHEANGFTAAEARRVAQAEFGNQTSAREQAREYGWENSVEIFFTDLRYAIRRLKKNPGFTTTSILTLALGIGATTAIFSIVNGVLLKPLPYPDSDRLVALSHTAPGIGIETFDQMSPSLYFTYRKENQTFEDIGLWDLRNPTVTGLSEPEETAALVLTNRMLPLLKVTPLLGRSFTEADDDDRQPKSVILTHGYWASHFGKDPAVLGRNILLDGNAHEVIGVLPPSFRFMDQKFSLLLPLQFRQNSVHLGDINYRGIGRLKPGVTIQQANLDIRRMIPISSRLFPASPGFSATMLEEIKLGPSLQPLKDTLIGNTGSTLWILMGALSIALLIACANVANLLLVRAEGRYQELIVRKALGAGNGRIARELLMESVLLGITGGLIGLLLAHQTLQGLLASDLSNIPRLQEISIDPSVLAFALSTSLLAGISFGLIPVWRYAKPEIFTGLKGMGRTQSQSKDQRITRNILIVSQVALALILLISSGLMIRTSRALGQLDPGFSNPDQLQTFRISIPYSQIQEREKVLRLQNDILERVSAITGVSSAAFISQIPFQGGIESPVYAEDRPYAANVIPAIRRSKGISPGLFSTIGSHLIAGRDMTWPEIYAQKQVVIITENLARELWKDPKLAVGKRLRNNVDEDWSEVIGVVSDLRDNGMNQDAPQIAYWPILRKYSKKDPPNIIRNISFIVRSDRTNSNAFIQELHQAVSASNPNLPLANISTLGEVYTKSMANTSFTTLLLTIAGSMALLLGVIGIYGVIAYSVSQRLREIGIRIALGASTKSVTGIFVRYGIMLSGTGTLMGLIASFLLVRLMQSLLFGVTSTDPLTYCVASVSLIFAAFLASYLPARRAAKVDPAITLRTE